MDVDLDAEQAWPWQCSFTFRARTINLPALAIVLA